MLHVLYILAMLISPAYGDEIENALTITEKECKKLIRIHAMTGPDYVPGVDVRGQKVVGADLDGGNQIEIPKEITFDLGVDLAERYDLGTGIYGKTNLGKVTVRGQNVYWNGKKLHESDEEVAVEACRQQYEEK